MSTAVPVLTAEQARLLAGRIARELRELGTAPGDRLAVLSTNTPDVVSLALACLHTGIAPALISGSATAREVEEMTSDIGATHTIDADSIARMLQQDGAESTLEPVACCRPMHFTSGTSGRPKAVWSGWLSPEAAQAWIDDETSAWGITGDDVHLVCGPLNHSAPLRFALMTLLAGGTVIVPPKFDSEVVLRALAQEGVTTTFMAPAHLQRLMEHAGGEPVEHRLRLLAHAGSACPDRVRLWAHETFGRDVVAEFYGSTEGQFTVCSADEWTAHPGTVGRPRPGRELRVDDDGVLWCKAPPFARFEYWGDPEKTRAAWDGDWFTVGDYGRIDADGYVYLEGRRGDLIITGGVNVYPAEIERVLTNLPGVSQIVAFGLPDEQWGQRVCVAITGEVTEEQVRSFAAEQLSGPKRPKSVFLAPEFPTTHSGKVDRVAVAARYS